MTAEVQDKLDRLDRVARSRGLTIGLAESCTAGLLASWIGARSGVSKWFQGAVISYSREVKSTVLGVPLPLLAAHGEVSLPVARAMAEGARRALNCDWAVSVTGIAGPSGGTKSKPVGTVCFALRGPGVDQVMQKNFAPQASRQEIQSQAATAALDLLIGALT